MYMCMGVAIVSQLCRSQWPSVTSLTGYSIISFYMSLGVVGCGSLCQSINMAKWVAL